MAVTGTGHRTPPRGIIPNCSQTGERITMDRTDDTARTISGETKGRPVFPLLDRAASTTIRPNDEARHDAMTGIPDNVAFQTYVILRCNRWGFTVRWLSRLGVTNPVPGDPVSWWGPTCLDGNVEQTGIESVRDVCPWNLDEARETGLCVNALPGHLSATVEEEYVKRGDRELKAFRLGIDTRTFRRRLSIAHPLLLELFNLAAAGLPLEISYRSPGRPAKPE